GKARHQKTDIFKGVMFFTFADEPDQFLPVPARRVKEIIEMNKRGEKPDELGVLKTKKEIEQVDEPDFENVVGQDSLTRFDQSKRKKNKKKKKGPAGANPNPNAQQTGQQKRSPQQRPPQGPKPQGQHPNQQNRPRPNNPNPNKPNPNNPNPNQNRNRPPNRNNGPRPPQAPPHNTPPPQV
ncbi:MAG TPA: hypothetical protein VFJ43_15060, partial [Bacteroidia bacterium]|nr:hypothetical protein [Bacteroidia bacterium]